MIVYKDHNRPATETFTADGPRLNDWDPSLDYGTEYARVYFRIATEGYKYPDFHFLDRDKAAFYKDASEALGSVGWECEAEPRGACCATWAKGKSHLYLHPQEFSGEVLKNEIGAVAEALTGRTAFRLIQVDVYGTLYDITDEEYAAYLDSLDGDIRAAAMEACRTSRKTLFYSQEDIVRKLSEKFRRPRVRNDDGKRGGIGQTGRHIEKILESMEEEGWLVAAEKNGQKLIRTINKAEQKERKLHPAG